MQSNIKLAQLGKKAPIITKYMGRPKVQTNHHVGESFNVL